MNQQKQPAKKCACGHCDYYVKFDDVVLSLEALRDGAQNRLRIAESDLELIHAEIQELNGRILAYSVALDELQVEHGIQKHVFRQPPKTKPNPKAPKAT